MRDLLASSQPDAKLAVDYFVYRAAREIGALASVLEGIDGLVFTAGIGENSAEIRAAHLRGLVLARRRARCERQREEGTAHLHTHQPGLGLDDSNQRGTDDRAPYRRASRLALAARRAAARS